MAQIPLLPTEPFSSPPLRRVAVFYHPKVRPARAMADQVRELADRLGLPVHTSSVWDTAAVEALIPQVDVCVVLGGDGSMLRAARFAAPHGVPVLGINLGKLGFLAELEPDELEYRLPTLLGGNYWIEERIMIDAELYREGALMGRYDCLNEVVVGRRQLSRVVRIHASIDGHGLTIYTADGVLVATPTGSTAYALAAGGPILHPEVRNLVLVPISAHLSLRGPLVLPETTEVRLTVQTDHEAGASFDGQSDVHLLSNDQVVVRVGPRMARFVRGQERSYFYHTLVHKLGVRH
ncbi:MAG TPA: NAD(+)/NADH kinase [Chloroflexota bacterium]